MPTNPGTGGSLARTIDEQFLALMCFNEDLLRAEFDAIITAEWPRPAGEHTGPRSRPPAPRERCTPPHSRSHCGTGGQATTPRHRRMGPATLTLPAAAKTHDRKGR